MYAIVSILFFAISLVFSSLKSVTATAAAQPLQNDHLDPICAPGTFPGIEANTWQFDVPAAKFYNQTASFFNSEWYTGPLITTHGKDNTVGATRVSPLGDKNITERLVEYSWTSSKLVIRFVLDNGPVVFPDVPGQLGNVTYSSYTEDYSVESICGGTATYMRILAVHCADKINGAFNTFDKLHRSLIDDLANKVQARVFQGTCPTTAH